MIFRKKLLTGAALAGLAVLPAFPAQAVNPYYYSDREPISITGTVLRTSGDTFTLDYGTGAVIVEMDDWDFLVNEADQLKPGERVTVTGRIDDDLFEAHTIEAGTVYVHDRFTYYYADSADEEGPYTVYSYSATVPEGNWISASGRVSGISGREFTLDTGFGAVTVDTAGMIYNPLDQDGYQIIEKGDRVSVSGILDKSFFEGREIEATTIVELTPSRNPQKSSSN